MPAVKFSRNKASRSRFPLETLCVASSSDFFSGVPPKDHETKLGAVLVRNPTIADIPAILSLHRRCFPQPNDAGGPWNENHLRSHLHVFPEGQLLAEKDGKILGVASSLIVSLGRNPLRKHTYDHSNVHQMIDQGEIKQEQPRIHPHRNFVTQAQSDTDTEISERP